MTHTRCKAGSRTFASTDPTDIIHGSSVKPGLGRKYGASDESGFSLVEMSLSAVILLVMSLAVFDALNRIQQTALYQSDVQAVIDNTRNALQTIERCIRQAGNDPHQLGFDALSIVSPTEVRILSDLTGSAGAGNTNKGDPDGDVNDSGENLLIRYNSEKRRLEMASRNGSAQTIAENITDLSLTYFNADGNPTVIGSRVRKITITISGTSLYKNPWTGREFGVQLESTICILT